MSEKLRLGIFGGTFDPIHNAHIDIARAALAAARLDKVFFVVSARPPHKRTETHASPEERLEMVRAALEGDERLEPSDVELVRSGYSYTVDTLETFRRDYANSELFLIIGYDSLIDLPRWRQPERILEYCTLLVVPRPRMHLPPPSALAGHYQLLPFRETELSSTEIRERVAQGRSVGGLLPPAVERIISERNIYKHEAR